MTISADRLREIEHDLPEWEETRRLLAELDGCSAEADATQVARARLALERIIPAVRELLGCPTRVYVARHDSPPAPAAGPVVLCALHAMPHEDEAHELRLRGGGLMASGDSYEHEFRLELLLDLPTAELLQQTLRDELRAPRDDMIALYILGEINTSGQTIRCRRERLRDSR